MGGPSIYPPSTLRAATSHHQMLNTLSLALANPPNILQADIKVKVIKVKVKVKVILLTKC